MAVRDCGGVAQESVASFAYDTFHWRTVNEDRHVHTSLDRDRPRGQHEHEELMYGTPRPCTVATTRQEQPYFSYKAQQTASQISTFFATNEAHSLSQPTFSPPRFPSPYNDSLSRPLPPRTGPWSNGSHFRTSRDSFLEPRKPHHSLSPLQGRVSTQPVAPFRPCNANAMTPDYHRENDAALTAPPFDSLPLEHHGLSSHSPLPTFFAPPRPMPVSHSQCAFQQDREPSSLANDAWEREHEHGGMVGYVFHYPCERHHPIHATPALIEGKRSYVAGDACKAFERMMTDEEAANSVADCLDEFRRRWPASRHEQILLGLIQPKLAVAATASAPAAHSWAAAPLDDSDLLESIFSAANALFFNGRLTRRVRWDWSDAASSSQYGSSIIGHTSLRRARDGGFETFVLLSAPILRNSRYSRRLLISAFLHELIHCYLFVCCGWSARQAGGHTPGFRAIAALMDRWAGRENGLYLCHVEADLDRFREHSQPAAAAAAVVAGEVTAAPSANSDGSHLFNDTCCDGVASRGEHADRRRRSVANCKQLSREPWGPAGMEQPGALFGLPLPSYVFHAHDRFY